MPMDKLRAEVQECIPESQPKNFKVKNTAKPGTTNLKKINIVKDEKSNRKGGKATNSSLTEK